MTTTALPVQLFVGLGNPGPEYASTRHNAGQWFIDALAKHYGVSLLSERKLKSQVASMRIQDSTCRLCIPNDYMNCCGATIQKVAAFYQIPAQAICVIHDELDLPTGIARIKYGGGHGGHNGLRDILQHLSTPDFYRLRIGIGHPGQKHLVSHFVLKPPSKTEAMQIQSAIDSALPIVDDLACGDINKAMRVLHQPTN